MRGGLIDYPRSVVQLLKYHEKPVNLPPWGVVLTQCCVKFRQVMGWLARNQLDRHGIPIYFSWSRLSCSLLSSVQVGLAELSKQRRALTSLIIILLLVNKHILPKPKYISLLSLNDGSYRSSYILLRVINEEQRKSAGIDAALCRDYSLRWQISSLLVVSK